MAFGATEDSAAAGTSSVESRRGLLIGLALAVWFGVAAHGLDTNGATLDMGEFLSNPVRMLYGELPYRDFWLVTAPGEVLLPAWLYQLGLDMNGVKRVMAAVSVLAGLMAFAVARRLLKSDLAATLVACLVFFDGLTYHHQGFRYIHVYLVAVLAAFGCLLHFWSSGRRRSLFACGLLLGLGMSFRLFYAGGAAAACFLTLAWESRRRGDPPGSMFRNLGALASGVLVVLAGVSLLLADVLPEMGWSVLVESVAHGSVRSAGGYLELLIEAGRSLASTAGALFLGAPVSPGRVLWVEAVGSLEELLTRLLPFLVVALFSVWSRATRSAASGPHPPPAVRAGLWTLLIWGGILFLRGFTRGSIQKIAHATTPLFFILVFLWREFRRLGNESGKRSHRLAASVLFVFVLGFGLHWAAVTYEQIESRIHLRPVVRGSYGKLYMSNRANAADAQRVIDLVTATTREGDFLFATPKKAPVFYALTRRRNPTRYDSLIDLVYRPSEAAQREVCGALVGHRTALVVHSRSWGFGPDPALQFDRTCPILNDCIERAFEPLAQVGEYEVLRSRGP